MILLKKIQLKNFLSHPNTELDFSSNTKILIDGKSGSGKSSIVEGLVWALYGESRSDNRSLVKHGEKNASVTVELIDDANNTVYRIERKTSTTAKNTLSVLESTNGSHFIASKTLGIKDTQSWIEKDLLHASYTLFINSIAYPQDNIDSFVKQSASKRKDLLLEIANTGNFDEYYSKAKDLLNINKEKLSNNSTLIENLKLFINVQEKNVVDKTLFEKKIDSIDGDIVLNNIILKELDRKRLEVSNKIDKIKGIKDLINSYKDTSLLYTRNIESINRSIAEIKAIDISKLEKEIYDLEILVVEYNDLEKLIKEEYERQGLLNSVLADKPADRDYDSEIASLNSKLNPLITEEHSCPAGANCPFIKPIQTQIAYFVEQIQSKQAKRDALEKEKALYQDRLSKIGTTKITATNKARFEELKVILKRLPGLKNDLDNLTLIIFNMGNLESKLSETQKAALENTNKIIEKEKELFDLEKEIDPVEIKNITEKYNKVNGILSGLQKEKESVKITLIRSDNAETIIKDHKDKIKDLTKEFEFAKMEGVQLELIKEAFGSKGLKTVVVDFLIPRLEDRINEVLSKLSDFTVRLDTQKSTADGEGTVEGLFINITNQFGQETGYDLFSCGEKVKITIAISEALASLQKCGFRILDEAIISLDRESTEALVDVLGKIQERFMQMVCISHLPEVKDTFENRIEIIKINGNSKIN